MRKKDNDDGRKRMRQVLIIAKVLIVLGLVGCGKSKEKTILGKWKEVGGTQTIEFFKDGTVTVIDEGEPPLTGDYRFIDDNRIRMDLKGLGELLGPVIAEVCTSKDEITLTAPHGKIEKYRKLRQIEITKSGIAGDYTVVTKTPDREDFKLPGTRTLKDDGTGLLNLSGKWEIIGEELEFSYGEHITGPGAQITTETLRREPPQVSLKKQRNAKVIEELKTGSILWSQYYFAGDRSDMIKSCSLEINEHGTFREITLYRNAWRIKDGLVEITALPKNQKGKIEGDTIVFQDGERETRYIRVEQVHNTIPGKYVGKYVFEGGIVGEKAEREPGVFLFNKDGSISYVPPRKRKIKTSFTWEVVKDVVQICDDGEILFSGGKVENEDIVFDKFGTLARFIKQD